jgi:hypothetical protein
LERALVLDEVKVFELIPTAVSESREMLEAEVV